MHDEDDVHDDDNLAATAVAWFVGAAILIGTTAFFMSPTGQAFFGAALMGAGGRLLRDAFEGPT